jgi:catechol 2,3-dioxygenase-like lactoylglutathione lyase family enzyme
VIALDHVSLRVADVARSRAFYEAVLLPLGFRVNRDFGAVAAGFGDGPYAVLALVRSESAVQPVHLAFRLGAREDVDAFHATALSVGAIDHGAPGLRPHYHASYYAGFVLDPDGHNLEAVCHAPPAGHRRAPG